LSRYRRMSESVQHAGSARHSTTCDVYCMRAVPVTPRWRVKLMGTINQGQYDITRSPGQCPNWHHGPWLETNSRPSCVKDNKHYSRWQLPTLTLMGSINHVEHLHFLLWPPALEALYTVHFRIIRLPVWYLNTTAALAIAHFRIFPFHIRWTPEDHCLILWAWETRSLACMQEKDCGICGWQSGTVTGLSHSYRCFPLVSIIPLHYH
jgi:hypothetical protein